MARNQGDPGNAAPNRGAPGDVLLSMSVPTAAVRRVKQHPVWGLLPGVVME